MLVSYQAVVANGQIQLREPVNLPDGLTVLIVVAWPPELTENQENEALNQAMDEALGTPLLTREEALAYLEQA